MHAHALSHTFPRCVSAIACVGYDGHFQHDADFDSNKLTDADADSNKIADAVSVPHADPVAVADPNNVAVCLPDADALCHADTICHRHSDYFNYGHPVVEPNADADADRDSDFNPDSVALWDFDELADVDSHWNTELDRHINTDD